VSDQDRGSDGPLSVTIKYGKGYEDSWISVRGSAAVVREELIRAFDLDRDESLSLAALVLNATQQAHALHALGRGAGAQAISGERVGRSRSNPSAWQGAQTVRPAANPSRPPQEDGEASLRGAALSEIEGAESVEALKLWWAKNQSAFADPQVKSAYKARGKALQAASAK